VTTIRQQLTRRLLVAFGTPLLVCGVVAYLLIRHEMLEHFESRDGTRTVEAGESAGKEESGPDEQNQDELDERIATIAILLAGCGVALLAMTFFVVPRIVRRAFAPVDALSNVAAGITASSLATRFNAVGLPGELAPIATRLNELLARLERSFDRERQFSADVAHELRTPIAELRTLAESVRKWPDTRSAEHDRDIEAIAHQMDGLVSRLLTLVRSDDGKLAALPSAVDLVDLVTQTWKALEARAAERKLTVELTLSPSAPAFTDPVLAKAILGNVLQNAVEYAPTGSVVQVALVHTAGLNTFRVSNAADHLTEADVSRLFDRFWRHDSSRTGNDHAGLGLPLAQVFATAVGGELSASIEGGRLTIKFTLPAMSRQNQAIHPGV